MDLASSPPPQPPPPINLHGAISFLVGASGGGGGGGGGGVSCVVGPGILKKSINRKIRGRLSYMDHEKHFSERYSVLRLTHIGRFQYEILRS